MYLSVNQSISNPHATMSEYSNHLKHLLLEKYQDIIGLEKAISSLDYKLDLVTTLLRQERQKTADHKIQLETAKSIFDRKLNAAKEKLDTAERAWEEGEIANEKRVPLLQEKCQTIHDLEKALSTSQYKAEQLGVDLREERSWRAQFIYDHMLEEDVSKEKLSAATKKLAAAQSTLVEERLTTKIKGEGMMTEIGGLYKDSAIMAEGRFAKEHASIIVDMERTIVYLRESKKEHDASDRELCTDKKDLMELRTDKKDLMEKIECGKTELFNLHKLLEVKIQSREDKISDLYKTIADKQRVYTLTEQKSRRHTTALYALVRLLRADNSKIQKIIKEHAEL